MLRLMGAVPGQRNTAVSLLNSGFWVAVIPGTYRRGKKLMSIYLLVDDRWSGGGHGRT